MPISKADREALERWNALQVEADTPYHSTGGNVYYDQCAGLQFKAETVFILSALRAVAAHDELAAKQVVSVEDAARMIDPTAFRDWPSYKPMKYRKNRARKIAAICATAWGLTIKEEQQP